MKNKAHLSYNPLVSCPLVPAFKSQGGQVGIGVLRSILVLAKAATYGISDLERKQKMLQSPRCLHLPFRPFLLSNPLPRGRIPSFLKTEIGRSLQRGKHYEAQELS